MFLDKLKTRYGKNSQLIRNHQLRMSINSIMYPSLKEKYKLIDIHSNNPVGRGYYRIVLDKEQKKIDNGCPEYHSDEGYCTSILLHPVK